MSDQTERDTPPDPWVNIDDREEYIGGTWYLTRHYVDTARAQVDAQIADLRDTVSRADQARWEAEAEAARLSAQVGQHRFEANTALNLIQKKGCS